MTIKARTQTQFIFTDSIEFKSKLETQNSLQEWAFKNSYFTFSIDSCINDTCYVFLGKKYNQPVHLVIEDSIENTLFINDINTHILKFVNEFNKKGYPFANIKPIETTKRDSIILTLKTGDLFTLDSISVLEPVISNKYLQKLLGIQNGDVYAIDKIKRIPKLISQNPLFALKSEPRIYFHKKTFTIELDLVKTNNNQFNGYVGFLPDNSNPDVTNYQFTGNLNLKLANVLKQGEHLEFNWNRLPDNSQRLDLKEKVSYLFGTSYGNIASLYINKRDSSFINIEYLIGAEYKPNFNTSLSAFYKRTTSNKLREISSFNNSEASFYGLQFNYINTDNPFIPMKGYAINLITSIGSRVIKNNQANIEFSNGNISATIDIPKTSTIYQIDFQTEHYLKIKSRSVWFNEILASSTINPYLFENELSFVGGLNSLRGIDDNSELTSTYAILKNEYRFHLERYTYLALFTDYGYLIRSQVDLYSTKHILSFGSGLNFSSKAGLFSLYYAISKVNNNPLFLRDAKIHIGYTSRF